MSYFTNLILEHGIKAMFFIILIEYACFPISSEIVLPFSGAVASLQGISFLQILPFSVVAGLIGTSICYLFGRMGGPSLLEHIMAKFPKSKVPILASFQKFEKYGTFAVCIGRVIPLCRTYIAFVSGSSKQGYPIFLGASFLGITIWNSLLIGLGYGLRENWSLVIFYYEQYKYTLLLLSFLIFSIFFLSKIKKSRF